MVRPAPTVNLVSDAGDAANMLSSFWTPGTEEALSGMSHNELLDMVMVHIVHIASGTVGLRKAIAHSSEALGRALSRGDGYKKESQAQAENLARLRQKFKAYEESMGNKLREAESRAGAESGRASAAEAKLELASERLKMAEAQVDELARRLRCAEEEAGAARNEARAAAEKAAVAERAAIEAGSEKAGAVACADEASARAEEAEGRAWEAEARAKEAEARIKEVEAHAKEAEIRAREAETRTKEAETRAKEAEDKAQRSEVEAGRIIADYKTSSDFKQEVIEGSVEAYIQGFEVCKAKVAAALDIDIAELEGIYPGETDEEPTEGKGDEGKPGPSNP